MSRISENNSFHPVLRLDIFRIHDTIFSIKVKNKSRSIFNLKDPD